MSMRSSDWWVSKYPKFVMPPTNYFPLQPFLYGIGVGIILGVMLYGH